jgi:dCMP deaminase
MNRPSWDQYFSSIASLTGERSNCIRRKVGCVLVKNNRILSLGYNGTPRGMKNCYEGGCKRCMEHLNNSVSSGKNLDLCICIHAEENAMLFLSMNEMEGSTLYVSLMPCLSCAKKIIQCQIKKVVFLENYSENDIITLKMLQENGVEVVKEDGVDVIDCD